MPRVSANGIELHYDEAGVGSEPLLLVHGYTHSRRNWIDIIPRLPLDRFHVYAFDLRGAGLSGAPASGYDTHQYADDIAVAMTALGVETFHYVGHSLGGVTGMQLAIHHPQRLRKLVLVAPGMRGTDRATTVMRALRDDLAKYREFVRALQVRPWRDGLVQMMAEDGVGCSQGHFEQSGERFRPVDVFAELEQIDTPTLMIVGDRDALRPSNLDDAARIPNCALAVFYRAGHMVAWDMPAEFTATLVDFLEHGPAPILDWEAVSKQLEPRLTSA